MTTHGRRVAAIGLGVGLAACVGCASKKKVELIYEEPVTNVWTERGQPQPPPQARPADATVPAAPAESALPPGSVPPAQSPAGEYPPARYPAAAASPGYLPPPQAAPAQPQNYPPPAQAPQAPPGGWRSAPPPPQPPPTGFPDPSVTTVVVPDQNPTTQTTLKRRTGWVRGGYD